MIFDVVAQDAKGRDVLVGEIINEPGSDEQALARRFEAMTNISPSTPFGMVVDPEAISIQDLRHPGNPESFCQLRLADVLRRYEPKFGEKQIYYGYLVTLLEAWLRDLADRWNRKAGPPGLKEMTALGLTKQLKGGTTLREVPFGEDSLR